jgi:TIR domain-containing protein
MPSQRTSKIFISYRREDSEGWAGRLADELQRAFGVTAVFYDHVSIEPGSNWRQAVEAALIRCRLLVAMIGPRWLNAANASGARRLDDPEDLVRFELAIALDRQIPILPVLVAKASLPRPVDLPKELQGILHHQAVELPGQHWKRDMECLLTTAEGIIGTRRESSVSPGTLLNIGEKLTLNRSKAGSVIGVRGDAIPGSVKKVVVGRRANIVNSKMQDMVGVEISPKTDD